MTEYRTGYLSLDEMEAELLLVADELMAAGVAIVYVTYGFGCDRFGLPQSEAIPVATDRLAWFIADSEARGIFELGEADLHIEGGGVAFTLCHEHDIHCAGEDCPLLREVRGRWVRDYPESYGFSSGGKPHRLASRRKGMR